MYPHTPLVNRLWRGMFPGLIEAEDILDVPDYMRSYVMTYLERDVRRAGDIQALETFRRFMGLLAALTGGEINLTQLGRDIGIARATATKWLSLLSATYQWLSIPPYHGNTIKRISGHPKGYLQDTGLACFLQRISSPESLLVSPFLGALFETFVVTEIRKQIAAMPTQPSCYHWRTHAGAEVDLILEIDGKLWPFEFKAGTRISGHDTSGIKAFRKTYPHITDTPGAIIAAVETPQRLPEDIWVLPYDLL
jgi:predicted AAA+ superfamily ATPase